MDPLPAFLAQREGSTLLLAPQRNISSLAAADVQRELQAVFAQVEEADVQHVVIDLEALAHFGSETLRVMHMVWKRLRPKGGKMVVCNVSRVGRDILQVARFDLLWPILPDRPAALAALA